MPIARSAVLWAHVLTSLVANLLSLVIVIAVAVHQLGFCAYRYDARASARIRRESARNVNRRHSTSIVCRDASWRRHLDCAWMVCGAGDRCLPVGQCAVSAQTAVVKYVTGTLAQ